MAISTNFLKNERQFRREYPDIASKMGEYYAEIGIHKYSYRELKSEINIYVIKLEERNKNSNENNESICSNKYNKS